MDPLHLFICASNNIELDEVALFDSTLLFKSDETNSTYSSVIKVRTYFHLSKKKIVT